MADNADVVVGTELLAAAQGVEFHRPLRSSDTLETAVEAIRSVVAPYGADRYFAPDLEAAAGLIRAAASSAWSASPGAPGAGSSSAAAVARMLRAMDGKMKPWKGHTPHQ